MRATYNSFSFNELYEQIKTNRSIYLLSDGISCGGMDVLSAATSFGIGSLRESPARGHVETLAATTTMSPQQGTRTRPISRQGRLRAKLPRFPMSSSAVAYRLTAQSTVAGLRRSTQRHGQPLELLVAYERSLLSELYPMIQI